MKPARLPYDRPMALSTDLYELTMAYGYWKLGLADHEAVFHVAFREPPFGGAFAVACGLGYVAELLDGFAFEERDLAYLATLAGNDGRPLFPAAFLTYLAGLRLAVDLDAMPEGTLAFAHEPLVRVTGPLLQAQLLETLLLTTLNFQTLVATKAARVCWAADGDQVLEFGLRRAQGLDGGLAAARAAYVGGVDATSNVLAGQVFGIPVRGTHAHSWVMAFADEAAAFAAWADAMPNNGVFLVDTYETLAGVRHAIAAGRRLRARGHALAGIRLDSGDLAALSIEARRMLDAAGFEATKILASGDLDEHEIAAAKERGARVDLWGVGTRLTTAYEQPALGGVYKLAAIRAPGAAWRKVLKLSDSPAKISTPGILQVRRFVLDGRFVGDAIYDLALGIGEAPLIVDPTEPLRQERIPAVAAHEDLLVPVYRGGRRILDLPSLEAARARARAQLASVPEGVRRFSAPQRYLAGLEHGLHRAKMAQALAARGERAPGG